MIYISEEENVERTLLEFQLLEDGQIRMCNNTRDVNGTVVYALTRFMEVLVRNAKENQYIEMSRRGQEENDVEPKNLSYIG